MKITILTNEPISHEDQITNLSSFLEGALREAQGGKTCNTLRSPTKGTAWTVIIRPTHSPPAEQDEAIAQLLQSPA